MSTKPDAPSLAQNLFEKWGPMMGGIGLAKALGFPTTSAMRQAIARDQVSLKLFKIAGRRGRFALTQDVSNWLSKQAEETDTSK
jgi:hypothetical protein